MKTFDKQSFPTRFGPACSQCKHVRKTGDLRGNGWTCLAFPDGIPSDVVISDGETHVDHLPDDNGFIYTPIEHTQDGIRFVFDWDGDPVIIEGT